MLDTVVISAEDVCSIVVLGTLVHVSVFSVIWLLMIYVVMSVCVPESGVCVHIFGED